jgi:hypothetical protein
LKAIAQKQSSASAVRKAFSGKPGRFSYGRAMGRRTPDASIVFLFPRFFKQFCLPFCFLSGLRHFSLRP